MYINSIISKLNIDNIMIKNGIVYNENIEIGIIRPSLIESEEINDHILIFGEDIIKINNKRNKIDIFKDLCNSKIIIFGSTSDIVLETYSFIKSPDTSRTTSYFLSFINTCDDFISAMNNLNRSNVLIVGSGGIGSLSTISLIGAGLKNITIIDGDTIESSNFNRQFLWSKNDIGYKKVDVLKKYITDRYDNINLDVLDKYINEQDLVKFSKNFDLVIVSADEPLGVGNYLVTSNVTNVILCGYINSKLSFNFLKKNHNVIIKNNVKFKRIPFFIGPSFGPSNIEISGIVSSFAIHFLCGFIAKEYENIIWDTKNFPRVYSSPFE